MAAAKAGMTGGMLQYAPPGQALDGGNFSAFIMAAMLDAQVPDILPFKPCLCYLFKMW